MVDGQLITSMGAWQKVVTVLEDKGVVNVQPQEVAWCQEKGMTLLDVRTEKQFSKGFILGAVNVPMYQLISKWDAFSVARRVGFAAFGVFDGTEPNPNFVEEVEASADKDAGVVICCALGGDLLLEGEFRHNVQSRSMVAAYLLVTAGFTNVKILAGGTDNWEASGRDWYVADWSVVDEDAEVEDAESNAAQDPAAH